MTIQEAFQDQIRTNRSRLLFFLLLYLMVTVVTGYLVGLALEPVFDRPSHLARITYGLYLPWDEGGPDGPTPFLEGAVFKVMVAFLVGAGVYCAYLAENGAKVVLALVGARPLRERQLSNVVEEMAVAAGMKRAPQVWLVEDPSCNAFACGDLKNGPAIVMTRGLLERLDRDEIQAVVAHETAHLRNGDTRLMTLLFGVVRAVDAVQWVVFLGLKLLAWLFRKGGREALQDGTIRVEITEREDSSWRSDFYFTREGDEVVARHVRDAPPEDRAHINRPWADLEVRQLRKAVEELNLLHVVGALLVSAFVLAILASVVGAVVLLLFGIDRWDMVALAVWVPLALLIVRMAVSRNREFQADMTAVALTRNPGALRSALMKLRGPQPRPANLKPSVNHFCIVPLVSNAGGGGWGSWAEQQLYNEWGVLDRESLEAVWRWARVNVSPAKQLMARVYVPLASGQFLLWGLWGLKAVVELFATHPPTDDRMERLERAGGGGAPA